MAERINLDESQEKFEREQGGILSYEHIQWLVQKLLHKPEVPKVPNRMGQQPKKEYYNPTNTIENWIIYYVNCMAEQKIKSWEIQDQQLFLAQQLAIEFNNLLCVAQDQGDEFLADLLQIMEELEQQHLRGIKMAEEKIKQTEATLRRQQAQQWMQSVKQWAVRDIINTLNANRWD